MHVQMGPVKSHLTEVQLKQELILAETLLIGEMKPCPNRQDDWFNIVLIKF